MAYDHGLAERMADALLSMGEHGIRQKSVFGGRGFLVGKSMFAVAWEDGMIVKSTPADYPMLLKEPGVTPFTPSGEKRMTTWLVVQSEAIADDPELAEWLRRALRAIR